MTQGSNNGSKNGHPKPPGQRAADEDFASHRDSSASGEGRGQRHEGTLRMPGSDDFDALFDNPEAEEEPDTGTQEEEEKDVQSAQMRIEELEAEVASLKDKMLRAAAEAENIRKRMSIEVQDARKFAIANFANDIVGLTDNFQRALHSVQTAEQESNPALKSLFDGVEMTERSFISVLERHGIKRINPQGEMFDPHFHQAMSEVQDVSVPAGTVANVFQPGFVLGERILRPALVVVAKGGMKPMKSPSGDAPEQQAGGSNAPNQAPSKDEATNAGTSADSDEKSKS